MRVLSSSVSLLILCSSNTLPVAESFVPVQQQQQQQQHTVGRSISKTTRTTASVVIVPSLSASSNPLDDIINSASNKKSIRDRTPEEWRVLVQSVLSAIVEAGPRAGPARTLQATRAVSDTLQEYIPTLRNGFRPKSTTFKPAKALRQLFERLGATYVKLGQFIASSPTLFPAEYVTEFQKCLDQTETLDWNTSILPILESELGGSASLARLFSSIDSKPLASASIAQVHKAVLRETGEVVVLKIQKPGIDELLKADLGFLKVSSEILEFIQPDWERTSLKDIGADIQRSMLEELDFQKEATNLQEFRQFLQEQQLTSMATAPRVFPAYTTKKVLCMEYLDGVSLVDTDAMSDVLAKTSSNGAAPQTLESTIVTALNVWTTSVQTMPWFHADVHAGNLLLLKNDGRVGFLDFGIVGRVSPKTFNAVQELSTALAVGDYTAMAEALANMGATSEKVDIPKFASDLEKVMTKLMSVQPDVILDTTTPDMTSMSVAIEGEEVTNLLLEVVAVTENNGLRLPREFGLLVKQSLYFDRYLKILAPGLDVMNDERVGLSSSSSAAAAMKGDQSVMGVNGSSSSKSKNNDDVVIDV